MSTVVASGAELPKETSASPSNAEGSGEVIKASKAQEAYDGELFSVRLLPIPKPVWDPNAGCLARPAWDVTSHAVVVLGLRCSDFWIRLLCALQDSDSGSDFLIRSPERQHSPEGPAGPAGACGGRARPSPHQPDSA